VVNIKNHIVTLDAMGTQKEIAKKIRSKRADYVLALKKNQGNLFDDVKTYFEDKELLKECIYHRTIEKARSSNEKREYWQTDNIKWIHGNKEWTGFKSIIMTKNTIDNNGKISIETRYFISSLPKDIELVSRAIRKHWFVESYHWHLDVTFKEDANLTLEKQSSFNLNILRKLALNLLKLFDFPKKKYSIKKKRYALSFALETYISSLISL